MSKNIKKMCENRVGDDFSKNNFKFLLRPEGIPDMGVNVN
jgi:hypothetical protein